MTWAEQQRFRASDAVSSALFGWAVAASGTTLVVGAPYQTVGGFRTGAAYIFELSGGLWVQQQILSASDAAADDYFGESVAIDGDRLVIGARQESAGGASAGAAYVFAKAAGTWSEQQKLVASDAQAGDEFGTTVAISSTTIAVGAPYEATGGTSAGAVYIYVFALGTWTEQQKLASSDLQAGDHLGGAVALDGDTVAAAADGEDSAAVSAGAVYVFTRSAGVWTEQQKLVASDAQAYDYLGGYPGSRTVALDTDTLVIGAPRASTLYRGAVYIFNRAAGVWSETQKLLRTAALGDGAERFGWSVDIVGTRIAVGDPFLWVGPVIEYQGVGYIYDLSGGTWSETAALLDSTPLNYSEMGFAVALAGEGVVLGARYDADGAEPSDSGSAYYHVIVPPLPIRLPIAGLYIDEIRGIDHT